MKNKAKLATVSLGMVLACSLTAVAQTSLIGTPGIRNSYHDFSGSNTAWGISTANNNDGAYPLCIVCHTPHSAGSGGSVAVPLWNHQNSAQTFTLYGQGASGPSPTFLGTVRQPSASVGYDITLACLSCHDGVTAINAFYWQGQLQNKTVAPVTTSYFAIGTDLSKNHPVDFDYAAVAALDQYIQPLTHVADITQFGKAATIQQVMLHNPSLSAGNNVMSCASCHDIHRQIGYSYNSSHFLVAPLQYGELCLICHIK